VRKDMKLTWPRAETATDYITMATDPDLTVATKAAIQEMVDFLSETKGLTKHQAYQLTEHRRECRDHAARGSAQPGRAREDAQGHFQGSDRAVTGARGARKAACRTATARALRCAWKAAPCAAWSLPAW
jgi:hypothetical protein